MISFSNLSFTLGWLQWNWGQFFVLFYHFVHADMKIIDFFAKFLMIDYDAVN